ncbi:MAG: pyridoxamine 5'-phosphate oxidase family protein [Bacillota bacterium]|nr:pyridoxamine 5'-phosphate oxidase family protein [Bacillota bacterium]MDD3297944.1 pyridoxamine 5'-phosphate oxidase family protein [Bacillota bacterium]MDD3851415.1 pyridoxamine 5'-phosphate oxidase family protein [Bacillota bacterium]MDD4707391.1 pyridoxamine 5'-phosphate oxidase family protein [Bacillota bacterium]
MRRRDKEIIDRALIDIILEAAVVCRIALCEDDRPYIVPMNFAYWDGYLFLHSAGEGKKIDILKKNQNLCFEVDTECEPVPADKPCDWSMKYYSVIGFGRAVLVEGIEEKKKGLDVIVEKYSGKPYTHYTEEMLDRLVVIKVEIENITGKMSKG